jgi:ABC-type ATPase with predicted acetyltransferase domain
MPLPDFLPGKFMLRPGLPRHYAEFETFHYRPKRPATWAAVWLIDYEPPPLDPQIDASVRHVAIGVLSYPTAVSRGRQRYFRQHGWSYKQQIQFANRSIRTISRVVVHPQFRSLGLSTVLVRKLIEYCPTRYVEAAAMMGHAHPFFARAGMHVIEPEHDDQPFYYIFDREQEVNHVSSQT